MPDIERRYCPIELRVLDADGGKQVSWFPALFNSLSEDMWGMRESIKPSAFNKTIQEADIRALFNHDPNFVLGRNASGTLDLSVTRKGLRATVNPPDTQWANDLMVSVERGDISGGSFAFSVVKDEWTYNEDGSVLRELQEVKLFDVSLVTYPAYPDTNGSAVVRALMTASGIEPERLTHVLAKHQAGQPLDEAECAEVRAMFKSLIPEPPIEHSVNHNDIMRYRLRLLELGSKTKCLQS